MLWIKNVYNKAKVHNKFFIHVLNFSSLLCLSEMGIRVDSENHISSIVPGSVAADEGRIAVGDKIITVRRVVTLHTLCQIRRETVSLVFPRDLMFSEMKSRETSGLEGKQS